MQAVCSAVRINGLIGYRIKLVHREMSSHLEAYKCKPRSVDPDLKMDTRCTSAPGGGGEEQHPNTKNVYLRGETNWLCIFANGFMFIKGEKNKEILQNQSHEGRISA